MLWTAATFFSRKTGIVFHHVFFSRMVNAALISLGKNKREFVLKDGKLFRRQTGKWWKEISGLHAHHQNRKTGARNTDSGRELQYFYPLCRSLNSFCAKECALLVYGPSTEGLEKRIYLCWSLPTLYLHACQVRVTLGYSGLCCCTCVTSFRALINSFVC